MAEATYTYKINSVRMKSGESFTPGRINVFVGANSTILYDVKIGSNVIIGAGSLVNKSLW